LARLLPGGMTPWTLARFSVARVPAADKVRLSRRLHGHGKRPGLLCSPALALGPGVVLVPAEWQATLRVALEEAGATYDLFPLCCRYTAEPACCSAWFSASHALRLAPVSWPASAVRSSVIRLSTVALMSPGILSPMSPSSFSAP